MASKLEKEQVDVSPPKPKAPVEKEELKQRLTPMQYYVTQMKGTERYVSMDQCKMTLAFSFLFQKSTPFLVILN